MNRISFHCVRKRGVAAVEIIVGVTILALAVTFSMHAIINYLTTARETGDKTQALYLAEEELELVRHLRDASWSWFSSLSLNTPYYLTVTPTSIVASSSPEVIGKFTRSFYVSSVYRDIDDHIVASSTSGAMVDDGSRYVTAVITFGQSSSTVSLTTLLGNIDI